MDAEGADPFVDHTESRLVEAGPRRAVVSQAPEPVLDNHVGVRHASALHAAGYAASRALVCAALEGSGPRSPVLVESEIEYTAVGLGPLETVAEPSGEGWDRLGDDRDLTLATTVVTSDEGGKQVARLRLSWLVPPAAA